MANIAYKERVHLLQEGRIDFLQFVMNGDHSERYVNWCQSTGIEPSNDSAEFFSEMVEIDMVEHQDIDNMSVGIWN